MTGKEVVLMLMKRRGLTTNDMANRIGISRSALFSRINPKTSDNMTVRTLSEMLHELGYKLLIVRKGKEPEQGEIEIGGYEKETVIQNPTKTI